MPDGTFVKEIASLASRAAGNTVEIEGTTYCLGSAGPMDPRTADPLAEELTVLTLSALVDYLDTNRDSLESGEHLIHVQGPTCVRVLSVLKGRFRQRENPVTAVFEPPVVSVAERQRGSRFALNSFMSIEAFVIGFLCNFDEVGNRNDVLALVGNVKEEAVRQLEDDGYTQEVTSRKGRSLRADVKVKNPVNLAPYRTFPEVDQPVSAFVLRLRGGGEDDLPEVALFESDGGSWALTATQTIKDYLAQQLSDWVVLA